MFGSAIAAGTAFIWSLRHQTALGITQRERRRYRMKSVHLALCYAGFAANRSGKAAWRAGQAAFYCCAYDVITDWRNYDQEAFIWFKNLLQREIPGRSANIAVRLYEDERNGILDFDGLSRGVDALEFVTGMMESEQYLRDRLDFHQLGIVMQIVDDVLDLEDDLRSNEMNCLSSPRALLYLQTLLAFDVCALRQVLPNSQLLCRVVRSAQKKAEKLVQIRFGVLENFQTSVAIQTNRYAIKSGAK